MSILLWCVVVVLIAWIVLHGRTLRRMRESLDSARREIYGVQYEMYEKVHRLEAELAASRLELRAQAGELKVAPSTAIKDAVRLHPRVKEVLESFAIGGETGCQVDSTETLQQAALTYGQDLETLLTEITRMLRAPEDWTPSSGCGPAPVQIQALGQFPV